MSDALSPEVPPDHLLTDAQAAELLNVKTSWIADAARQRRIRGFVMLGRYRRWDRRELLEWIEEQKAGGGQRRPRAAT